MGYPTHPSGEPAPLNPHCRRLRPLAEYSRRLPSCHVGKRLNRATLWRWALRGLRNGRQLRTVLLGSGRMTCDAWVSEFLEGAGPQRDSWATPSGNRTELKTEEDTCR